MDLENLPDETFGRPLLRILVAPPIANKHYKTFGGEIDRNLANEMSIMLIMFLEGRGGTGRDGDRDGTGRGRDGRGRPGRGRGGTGTGGDGTGDGTGGEGSGGRLRGLGG